MLEQDPIPYSQYQQGNREGSKHARSEEATPQQSEAINTDLLLNAAIFADCTRTQIARLLSHAGRRRLQTGEPLYSAGDPADAIFLVESGALKLTRGRPDITIPQGALLGLDGMAGHQTYQDDVAASEACSVLILPIAALHDFAAGNPSILQRIFSAYRNRYQDLAARLFNGFGRNQLARLFATGERRTLAAGEVLYSAGDKADRVFIVEHGTVRLRQEPETTGVRTEGALGLEGLVGYKVYQDTLLASEESAVIAIPLVGVKELTKENPSLLKRYFLAHEGRRRDDAQLDANNDDALQAKKNGPAKLEIAGWILASLTPFFLYALAPTLQLSNEILFLIGIIMISVIMWLFNLVPVFVPPLFSTLMIVLLDVAPPEVALSGFSSNTFVMCLSVFGISAMMIKSGLAYRLSLRLVHMVPQGRIWYGFALFFVGLLLTPVIPSKNGRVAIVQPFLVELLHLADRSPRNDTATQFAMSATLGANLLSPIFLTGASLNLMMFGLFDEQTRFTFSWVYWLAVASIPGFILLFGYVMIMLFAFPNGAPINISRERLSEQSRVLGPMSSVELGTLAMVLCMIVLIPTTSFHKIDVPWLMLTISLVLLMFGAIGNSEFRKSIDWPILLFIGSLLAWPGVIETTGLEQIITGLLSPVSWYMKNEFLLFTLILAVVMVVLRFFLPINVAVIVFATVLLPVAKDTGISPWVVGFTILMMAEASVFSYQDIQRFQMESGLNQHGVSAAINQTKMNLLYLLITFMRIGVLLISIPIWYYLNIV